LFHGCGSERLQGFAGDEVAFDVEGVVEGSMGGQLYCESVISTPS
jgi:hypothetical protein